MLPTRWKPRRSVAFDTQLFTAAAMRLNFEARAVDGPCLERLLHVP